MTLALIRQQGLHQTAAVKCWMHVFMVLTFPLAHEPWTQSNQVGQVRMERLSCMEITAGNLVELIKLHSLDMHSFGIHFQMRFFVSAQVADNFAAIAYPDVPTVTQPCDLSLPPFKRDASLIQLLLKGYLGCHLTCHCCSSHQRQLPALGRSGGCLSSGCSNKAVGLLLNFLHLLASPPACRLRLLLDSVLLLIDGCTD